MECDEMRWNVMRWRGTGYAFGEKAWSMCVHLIKRVEAIDADYCVARYRLGLSLSLLLCLLMLLLLLLVVAFFCRMCSFCGI